MTVFLAWSEKKQRFYRCKFDHGEARRLHAEGHSMKSLAERFGVSWQAVHRVVDPQVAARMARYSTDFYKGTCTRCGAPAVSEKHPSKKGRPSRCKRCFSLDQTNRVRYDELGQIAAVRCLECQQWKQPGLFPKGSRNKTVRETGIHSQCRECGTKARQNYRLRHKIPCDTCGEPCLPPSEKGARAAHRAMCRPCYYKSVSRAAA